MFMSSTLQPTLDINEDELAASLCRDSFFDFVKEFWDVIIPDDFVCNWHIPYLCNELQQVAERVFRGERKEYDLVINIPPGTTKSTICSVMFPAWVWTRMPHAKIIGASYSLIPVASDLSRKNRDIVASEKYKRFFSIDGVDGEGGSLDLREDQKTKHYFINSKQGMRYAVGVSGSVTGMHGHFLIVDDPIDPIGARSEAEIRSTNTWLFETLYNRKTNKMVTPVILIMQRLHVEDPTAAMLERLKGKVKYICLPAEWSADINPPELMEHYKQSNGLLDPIRLNREVLEGEKMTGQYYYAGQFMQSPIPESGGMFDTKKLNFASLNPNVRIVRKVRFWDKAATPDDGCYTVGVLMGEEKRDNGSHYWVMDVVRGQWRSDIREQIIRQTAEKDGLGVEIWIEQEPGSGGKESAENTIRNLAGFRVKAEKPTGDKVERADPFSAQVNGGNVTINLAGWNKDYVDEMKFFGPTCKYKDQIDASSGAFNKLFKRRKILGAAFSKRK